MAIAIAKQEDREKAGCEKMILTRMYDVGPRNSSFEKGGNNTKVNLHELSRR